jgi:hypothetical protein
VELLRLGAVIDALSLVIVEPPVEDVVKPLLLVVAGVNEEIMLVVVGVNEEIMLVVVGVNEEIMLVVVVDGGLLATVVLLATKVVPGTMYPEASTQLPGAMFALPEVRHAWPTAHDQAWFVPRIKPQQMCSTSRQISPQAR